MNPACTWRFNAEYWGAIHSTKIPTGPTGKIGARSIQPKFPEISVQNSMARFGPTGKVSKKQVHLLRWSSFPGRTVLDFGWMDRAQKKPVEFQLNRSAFAVRPRHSNITADHFTAWELFLSIDACRTLLDSGFWILDSGFNSLDSGVCVSGTWIPDSNCSGFRNQRAVFYY